MKKVLTIWPLSCEVPVVGLSLRRRPQGEGMRHRQCWHWQLMGDMKDLAYELSRQEQDSWRQFHVRPSWPNVTGCMGRGTVEGRVWHGATCRCNGAQTCEALWGKCDG